jgi:serine/threonine protein kinase
LRLTSRAAPTNPERWQQIESLYHAALETTDEARDALLLQSDPEIRRAVEALLHYRNFRRRAAGSPCLGAHKHRFGSTYPANCSRRATRAVSRGCQNRLRRHGRSVSRNGFALESRRRDQILAAQFSERFEREAKAIASMNHPNICQIYDIGPNYLVMEFVDGLPIVSRGPEPIPQDKVLRLATQIASAMEAAHAKGIIHRDLKPANILVTAGGFVKLLDFGLAKRSMESSSPADATATLDATQVGMILGTPAYMSPEQRKQGGGRSLRYFLLWSRPLRDACRSPCYPGSLSSLCSRSNSSQGSRSAAPTRPR